MQYEHITVIRKVGRMIEHDSRPTTATKITDSTNLPVNRLLVDSVGNLVKLERIVRDIGRA
jgi:hypothetical protein